MSQDQPFIWISSLIGTVSWVVQSLWGFQGGANSISQVYGVSDMAPTSQLCGSVGEGFRKGQWPLRDFLSGRKLSLGSCIDARHFSSSLYATGAFQLQLQYWRSEGVSLSKSVCWFFKRNCLVLQKFLPLTQSLLDFTARIMGTYLPGTGTLDWVVWCRTGTPWSSDILPKFSSTTCECGTSLFHISVPPNSLDGCGFFNSIVVRLPFNSISDVSEWWLFYILVVILMWLCEEVIVFTYSAFLTRSSVCFFIKMSLLNPREKNPN